MPYVVSGLSRIDFAPATVADEVVQNISTILATQVGTVPLFRDFGVSTEAVDKPLPVARALVRSAIIDAVRRFEPRAVVESVDFGGSADDLMNGILRPSVVISIKPEFQEE